VPRKPQYGNSWPRNIHARLISFFTQKPEELITLLAKFAHAFTAPAPQFAQAVEPEFEDSNE